MRQPLNPKSLRAGAAVALLVLGTMLVACAPEAQLSGGAGGSSSPTGKETSDTSSTDDDTTPEGANADPEACVYGTWLANNDFFLASIRQFGDEVKSVTGQVTLQFADDGTVRTDYQGWIIASEVEGMAVTIERNGVDHGTFAVTEDTITIEETSVGSTLVMNGDGFNMAVDAAPVNYQNAGYTCDQQGATITTPDGTLQLDRQ